MTATRTAAERLEIVQAIGIAIEELVARANRRCVAIEHLIARNARSNAADARRHGRLRRGTNHPHAKLTVSDVRRIHRLRARGRPAPSKARKFGVSPHTIVAVATRRAWGHVT